MSPGDRPRRASSGTLPADSVLAVSRLLRPGEWTTYGDIGAAATDGRFAARLVARLAAKHPAFANAHRVLGSGGVVVRGAGGEAEARRARERLEDEGVPFRGRAADPECRVRWIELRGRLTGSRPQPPNEAVVIAFRDAAEFEAWLGAHVDLRAGVWLKIAKKGSDVPSLTSDEAVDVGLCYGWISGHRKASDEVHYLQKYVPRRPRSRWSQVNVARVEELIAAGRMRPSGLAEVEAAKADGRWAAAYESQRNATVPSDLAAALAASPRAARAFDALGKTQRYAVILKLVTARTATARAAQLRRAMTALEARGVLLSQR